MFLKDWWGKGRDGVRGWGGALWSWKQRMVQDRKRENPPEERVQSRGSRVLKPRWSTKGQICHFWSCPLNIPGKLILQLCHACPHIVENNTIATDISSKVDHVVLTWLCLCTSNLLACQWKALWWGLSHMFLSPAVWCSADRRLSDLKTFRIASAVDPNSKSYIFQHWPIWCPVYSLWRTW